MAQGQFKPVTSQPVWLTRLAFIGVLILFIVASLEAVSTFAECGPFDCPNDGSWDWWLF